MGWVHELRVEVPFVSLLDSLGQLSDACPAWLYQPELLMRAYRHLLLTRRFDQRAVSLQRTGLLGTYASCLGQEAVSTGIGLAMQADDLLAPYYRDQATQLLRGVSMMEILRYWGGDEAGNNFTQSRHDLPNCVPIATQISHAAGMAMSLRLRHQAQAVVTTCGDGATSRGDFYEPLNLAGVWHLPLVIVINNNQWAISVPRQAQTAATTLAQKAVAAGIPGLQVDGNDVLAVTAVVHEALERARAGKGPTLIEAVTYRLCDHTTADDMRRYCAPERLEQAQKEEPLIRMRSYLEHIKGWTEQDELNLVADIDTDIEHQVQAYLNLPPPDPNSMFDYLYANLPEELKAQRQSLIARRLA